MRKFVPVVDTAAAYTAFRAAFFASIPPEDLEESGAASFEESAVSLLQAAAVREQGRIIARVHHTIDAAADGQVPAFSVLEVINDDMPFLVDSITMEANRQGHTVQLFIHPVVKVERNTAGILQGIGEGAKESWIHLRLSPIATRAQAEQLIAGISAVLQDVRAAVTDWPAMRQQVEGLVAQLKQQAAPVALAEQEETCAFVAWLLDNNFTFLGLRTMDLQGEAGNPKKLEVQQDTGLGILRDDRRQLYDGIRDVAALPEDIQAFYAMPRLVYVSKASSMATVHRAVPLDVISIKRYNKASQLIGEWRLVGLFTSQAYHSSPRLIPTVRRKVAYVLDKAGFDNSGHAGKALLHILETYPRDELFQASEDDIFQAAIGILHLQERQRVALFVRRDTYQRFVSCLVFIPRDQYNLPLREKIQAILEQAFQGVTKSVNASIEGVALARLHMVITTSPHGAQQVDVAAVEARLRDVARSWSDQVRSALIQQTDKATATTLVGKFGQAFPIAYRDRYSIDTAAADCRVLQALYDDELLKVELYQEDESLPHLFHAKIYALDNPLPLSDIMPILANFGLNAISEATYRITPNHSTTAAWIHDFEMATAQRTALIPQDVAVRFQDALFHIWSKVADDDGLNALVLISPLGWRDVVVLRALARYLQQTQFAYGHSAITAALLNHPEIASTLVQLFYQRFDPHHRGGRDTTLLDDAIDAALQQVTSLAEDTILQTLRQVIRACVRTNYFRVADDGAPLPYVSFKFNSQQIACLPLPRPDTEIFVYAPHMEGIHLRGGKVARGGIRWSDRREDYRDEILGLMKAQMVKNAVIVPVGAKGGFIIKRKPVTESREAYQAEVRFCYETLIRGLLDITDNICKGTIVPPVDVVRHDGDDPYLVVAADKGTATFSDIANGISAEYGFWLGDAFASGGSVGYDHKKMGITAKGAWEAVKRHFREMGVDTQTQDFTVVGVGDMAGDVFGNGMLLSPHIRLQAAFNHRHIFIDPEPDAALSFQERQRLFTLPGSSWDAYDSRKLSAGGMIIDRSAKSVTLSPQIQQWLGLDSAVIVPAILIKILLAAPVDLLWFGGIGTFIRASHETDADVRDKANDALRVSAASVRAKVIGEGANLGMTQAARIECALNGVRLNTDAIDNSAGVDCSDHEVNIKILLQQVQEQVPDLTYEARNTLLEAMTEDVARLVLRNNYLQTQALTLAEAQAPVLLHSQAALMRSLEKEGKLNRAIEYLPDDETLVERQRQGRGLTRPESAVLLAYAKIDLYNALLGSKLPDEQRMIDDLERYFPSALLEKFGSIVPQHRLRREIIVAHTVNSLVNRMGAHFVHDIRTATGMHVCDIARSYAVSRDSFALRTHWAAVETLDNKVPAALQTEMLQALCGLVQHSTQWFLRFGQHPLEVTRLVSETASKVMALYQAYPAILSTPQQAVFQQSVTQYTEAGVPLSLATAVAACAPLYAACDIISLADQYGCGVADCGSIYYELGECLHLNWLRQAAAGMDSPNVWQAQALDALRSDVYDAQRSIAAKILAQGGKTVEDARRWLSGNQAAVASLDALVSELQRMATLDIAMLMVASRLLKSFTG